MNLSKSCRRNERAVNRHFFQRCSAFSSEELKKIPASCKPASHLVRVCKTTGLMWLILLISMFADQNFSVLGHDVVSVMRWGRTVMGMDKPIQYNDCTTILLDPAILYSFCRIENMSYSH